MARYQRLDDIIQLALALQVPGPGLCLEDVQQRFGVGRRTAERMREAVDRLYPGMAHRKGPDGRKYWRLRPGEVNELITWRSEEQAALAEVISDADTSGNQARAHALRSLHEKLGGLLGEADREIDERSVKACDPSTESLRRAIVQGLEIRLRLRSDRGETPAWRVQPHGVLGGARLQLVAFDPERGAARLVPLDSIEAVEASSVHFESQARLDLRRFAANALAPFEDGPLEVRWHFDASAADDVLAYEFHPDQDLDLRGDGSIDVRFRAAGLVEMAWHLFAWGDRVRVLDPPVLKHGFDTMVQRALDARLQRAETATSRRALASASGPRPTH